MRLIDADALKRKMQRVATEAWKLKVTAKVETIMNQFIDFIEEQPTIEPELIRCRDCRWHNADINQCGRQICAVMYGDDYCSYAERSEMDADD